jgi:rusticyanin
MKRTRFVAIAIAAATAAGLGGITACGSAGQPSAAASAPGGAAYSYYRSMIGRLDSGASGSMMSGTSSRGSMMSSTGYRLIMGGKDAPGWMRGIALPGYMMGSASDVGTAIGALFANAPGTRVSPARAANLGSQGGTGATASSQKRIAFSAAVVRLVVLASPVGGPAETFRIAGMVNPAIVVKAGARVSIEVINADPDTAQGLVVTGGQATPSRMPMMTSSPAFPGSAVWFLGNPTSAGMHAATLSFTAGTPGTYRYLCPVPGHAQDGMTGTFIVSSA